MATRGFFTTPSWSRSAVAMCLLLGATGLVACALFGRRVVLAEAGIPAGPLIFAVISLLSGAAALATGLRGVRAWQQSAPIPAAWYWPGLAACVLQGATISGGAAMAYFLTNGPMSTVPAWLIALVMLGGGGIPFLGALCCAGAWWVSREPADVIPVAELR